jgi:hypothetical protein
MCISCSPYHQVFQKTNAPNGRNINPAANGASLVCDFGATIFPEDKSNARIPPHASENLIIIPLDEHAHGRGGDDGPNVFLSSSTIIA